MNEKDAIELVNRHAEALVQGRGLSVELAGHDPEVGRLLTVAGRIKAALRPRPPRPAFVRNLKSQLLQEAKMQEAWRSQQWLVLAAGLGGLVYGLGLLAVGYRTSAWVLGLLAIALGWKKRQPVVKTAQ